MKIDTISTRTKLHMDSISVEVGQPPKFPIPCVSDDYKVKRQRHHRNEFISIPSKQPNDSKPSDKTDERIEFSTATPTARILRQKFLHDLCKGLCSRLPELRDLPNRPALSSTLTALMKAFAFKIGQDGSPDGLVTMYFIHHYSE